MLKKVTKYAVKENPSGLKRPITKLTTKGLITTGGTIDSKGKSRTLNFCNFKVKNEETNVAKAPQITSNTPKGLVKFEIKHPKVNPNTASGITMGKKQSDSENLTCTGKYASPKEAEIYVKRT